MIEPKVARSLSNLAPNPLFLRDEELTRGIELLDAAYRALIAEPDRQFAARGLGPNHRWLLYLIGRHPGTTMVELLASYWTICGAAEPHTERCHQGHRGGRQFTELVQ